MIPLLLTLIASSVLLYVLLKYYNKSPAKQYAASSTTRPNPMFEHEAVDDLRIMYRDEPRARRSL